MDKKEFKIREKIEVYGKNVSDAQKALNEYRSYYHIFQDDMTECRKKKKEILAKLVSKKHEKCEHIILIASIDALTEEINDLSKSILYLNELLTNKKREKKLLQQLQSSYISKLENYLYFKNQF